MRIALISDIHGNLEALTAVLKDIEKHQVDQIWCLGDVVGYGANPSECLKLVTETCDIRLMGNHDHSTLGKTPIDGYTQVARVSTEWTQDKLTKKDLDILESFTMEHWLDDVLAIHASPYDPEEWHYILTPVEADDAFGAFDGSICFHGHSHMPVIFTEMPGALPRRKEAHDFDADEENRYLINVGSVGQPRDNDPRACWVLYDSDERHIEYHRVEYDIRQTQSKMTEAQLPRMLVNRLATGR